MARRNREGEMRLGQTLVGDITLLEVVEVRMNEWMWMWMWDVDARMRMGSRS